MQLENQVGDPILAREWDSVCTTAKTFIAEGGGPADDQRASIPDVRPEGPRRMEMGGPSSLQGRVSPPRPLGLCQWGNDEDPVEEFGRLDIWAVASAGRRRG